MKPERSKKTAQIIQDHVGDRETTKQLRRLPTFKVPNDTREVFGPLLETLDEAEVDTQPRRVIIGGQRQLL